MQNNAESTMQERLAKWLAFNSSWKRTALDLIILALSGWYFTTAFPGLNFQLAAWTGIIPLIALCAKRSMKRACLYGFVWGYFWNLTACFFLREIMFFIPFVFAVILGLFTAVFGMMIPFLFKYLVYPENVRQKGFTAMNGYYQFSPWAEILCTFAFAGLWTGLEWIRSWIATGFPWNLVAVTQWQNNNFIQICEYTGIYGVSFLVVLMNAAVFFALHGLRYSVPLGRYKRPWPFLAAMTLCLVVSWLGGKTYEWRKVEYSNANTKYFAVGVVQPHLSQRRAGAYDSSLEALIQCRSLTEKLVGDNNFLKSGVMKEVAAMSGGLKPDDTPDMLKDVTPLGLIVWPESAVPRAYYSSDDFGEVYRTTVRSILQNADVPIILGTLTADNFHDGKYDLFNSALMLRMPERIDEKAPGSFFFDKASVYSKVHLVPFGEYIPFNDRYPAIGAMVGMGRNLTPGDRFKVQIPADGVKAGTLICYEDVFPYAAQGQAMDGANFLLVITNDAWYPASYEPEQHYANSIFRTIETRLPMVRCGNSNYSVLIDPRGRVIDSIFTKTDKKTGELIPDPDRKGMGSAKFIVPLARKHTPTFYTMYGNVFVLVCWFLFALGMIAAGFRKFDFRRHFGDRFKEQQNDIREDFKRAMSQAEKEKEESITSPSKSV